MRPTHGERVISLNSHSSDRPTVRSASAFSTPSRKRCRPVESGCGTGSNAGTRSSSSRWTPSVSVRVDAAESANEGVPTSTKRELKAWNSKKGDSRKPPPVCWCTRRYGAPDVYQVAPETSPSGCPPSRRCRCWRHAPRSARLPASHLCRQPGPSGYRRCRRSETSTRCRTE